jgi:hypothetical protein
MLGPITNTVLLHLYQSPHSSMKPFLAMGAMGVPFYFNIYKTKTFYAHTFLYSYFKTVISIAKTYYIALYLENK